ncbi:DUF6053 domain-containing protein [Lysobacter enzymogenes]|uniref:DUF6053 domain-containing protein n=1 Tax=Lysobacter enzymogenes TaxID=69 RepID=UPI003747F7C4
MGEQQFGLGRLDARARGAQQRGDGRRLGGVVGIHRPHCKAGAAGGPATEIAATCSKSVGPEGPPTKTGPATEIAATCNKSVGPEGPRTTAGPATEIAAT